MARQTQARRMSRASKYKAKSKTTRKSIRKSDFAVRGNNPQRISVFRGYGFPDTLRTNLSYSSSISLVPTALQPCPSYGFRLASLYDPDYTGLGGQPYWFDQLMAVYSRYKVLGAKLTAVFTYSSELVAGVGPAFVGIEVLAEGTGLSSTDPGVLRSTANVSSDLISTQSEPKKIVATYSPKQMFGGEIWDSLTGTSTANPGRNVQAFVFANPQGTDVTKPINCFVTIEYFAEFTQQIQNSGS